MNLWAESENLESTNASAGRAAKPGRARRDPAEQAILPALRAWLLADYVAPYCGGLAATRIFRRCFWIDGSGGASNESKKADEVHASDKERLDIFDQFAQAEQNGAESRLGTAKKARAEIPPPMLQPVMALAGELARESKPISLQGIVLGSNKSKRKREGEPDATFVLPKESSVIHAGWREAAPALLPAIEQFAAIFLLNPFAVGKSSLHTSHARTSHAITKSEVPFLTSDELAPLFQRTAPTELCLLLIHRQVEAVLLPALRTTAGAAAFTALLRSDRWKARLAPEREAVPTAEAIEMVIDLLQTSLQPHFLFVRRAAFPMVTGPARIDDAPCTLIFATRRQDSLAYMNDAVCGYRRRLEEESRRGLLNEAWFAAQQAVRDAQAAKELSEEVLREGQARAPRRWPDLRHQLLLQHFGQWTLRDYDEAIARLIQAGESGCEWRQPGEAANGGGQRVPGSQDILLWQVKKRRH